MAEFPVVEHGMSGPGVARLQRNLSRAGFHTRADGLFGPATLAALTAFQRAAGVAVDGIAGPRTWGALVKWQQDGRTPAEVVPPHVESAEDLSAAVLRVAMDELADGAREQGGNNRGPWVRKYMGVEGLPWCVGFATWCYRQACRQRGERPVLTERWSSSRLVKEARGLGLVIDPARGDPNELRRVESGHFFVLRGGPTGYSHTGIIRSLGWGKAGQQAPGSPALAGSTSGPSITHGLEYITTVEGNTTLRGEDAPDHVVSRWRGVTSMVFIAC